MVKAVLGACGAVACVLVSLAGVRAQEVEGPTLVRLQAGIDVDASGKVVAVELEPDTPLPDVLKERTRQTIQAWHFKPVMHAGHPVGGKTWAHVNLCLVPTANEGLSVAVSHGSNGPGEDGERSFPPLSRDLVRNARGDLRFDSVLRYRVNPDGRAELLEARLLDPEHAARYGNGWQREVRQWLSRRRFKPEVIDGQPVATVMEQPITTEVIKRVGSVREAEAHQRELQANTDVCRAAAGKPKNEAVAVDSRFELLSQG